MNYINITIVYALPEEQFIENLTLKEGSTVEYAMIQSNIFTKIKKSILSNPIGIYGKIVNLNYVLKNNDRIEIYRKLNFNPMDLRRKKILSYKNKK
ncbi:UPF0125 protein RatB [Buchnera aphidicola (Eriosoma lanigerum)]|uniref:RnfH family protein n=1 Tax=Buchnera aphidicola TaxID=9 RepID=UPI00346394B2